MLGVDFLYCNAPLTARVYVASLALDETERAARLCALQMAREECSRARRLIKHVSSSRWRRKTQEIIFVAVVLKGTNRQQWTLGHCQNVHCVVTSCAADSGQTS